MKHTKGKAMTRSDPIWSAGLMSGTSLDGVDAALVYTDGVRIHDFGEGRYRPYSADERKELRAVLGHWPGRGLESAERVILSTHHSLIAGWSPDIIGFHGQTLAHDPVNRRTHQLGDGAAFAKLCKAPVVWDFRTHDVSIGGQGAPLAPLFHFACAQWAGLTDPVAFLNLGGVGNLTWINPAVDHILADNAVLAFDTGPANAPLNDAMMRLFGVAQDTNGRVAQSGQVDQAWITQFLTHEFFTRRPPKSLDRDTFACDLKSIDCLNDDDQIATLSALPAFCVAKNLSCCPCPPSKIFVTGGGRHNPVMMDALADTLPCPVAAIDTIGLDGDLLEAQAFAYLAVRVLNGLPTSLPETTGVPSPACGGRVSSP
jgi:anhydro-N-acetylmuramic acid kinase